MKCDAEFSDVDDGLRLIRCGWDAMHLMYIVEPADMAQKYGPGWMGMK